MLYNNIERIHSKVMILDIAIYIYILLHYYYKMISQEYIYEKHIDFHNCVTVQLISLK